ncbi:MAG: hypothetical protein JWO31_715 [Phycisphaerales bacterium]|nr:hypothetical protein [Phycisphaerales bacterium]
MVSHTSLAARSRSSSASGRQDGVGPAEAHRSPVRQAVSLVVEALESRQLMSASVVNSIGAAALAEPPAPTADAGGPYEVSEGGTVGLVGSAAVADGGSAVAAYEWDFEYDGASFQVNATGADAPFAAGRMDGPRDRTIGLRVRDAAGRVSAVSSATVSIVNAPPTAQLRPGEAVTVGAASTVRFAEVTDPSLADVTAGFRYAFDFNNDGDFADPGDVEGSTSPTASFAFPASGTYTVRGRVTDKDGGASVYTTTVTVNPASPTVVPPPPPVEPPPAVPPIVPPVVPPLVVREARAEADAYVRNGEAANTNFGLAADLQVRNSTIAGSAREAYLRFPITGGVAGATLESAILRLYGRALGDVGPIKVDLYAVPSTTWGEQTIRWNGRPAAGDKLVASKVVAAGAAGTVEFNVSAYVKQRKAAGATAVSFVLRGSAPGFPYASFPSDEASANRPQLRLGERGTTSVPPVFPPPPVSPPPPGSTTTSLRAVADAYVRDGEFANTNFGAATELAVRRSSLAGQARQALLRFNLADLTSIGTATLRLWGRLDSTVNPSVTINALAGATNDWTEAGVTWANRPAAAGVSLGALSVTGTEGRWYTLNLTAWIKAQKAAGKTTATLVLAADNYTSSVALFGSDEAAANRPELVVTT